MELWPENQLFGNGGGLDFASQIYCFIRENQLSMETLAPYGLLSFEISDVPV